MNEEQEIRAYLDRLTSTDPIDGVDGSRSLERGRRGRRRRRVLASTGAVVAVAAAVAVTATYLPNPGAAQMPVADRPTAVPTQTAGPSSDPQARKTMVLPPSDTEVVSEPEALRRCRAQWAKDAGRAIQPIHVLSSLPIPGKSPRQYWVHTSMLVDYDDKPGAYDCSIPAAGEDRHGRILDGKPPRTDAAMHANPAADDATVLKACSASLARTSTSSVQNGVYSTGPKPVATDLTGWRVVTRSTLAGVGTILVAVSPQGDKVAQCEVYPPGSAWDAGLRSTARTVHAAPTKLTTHLLESGSVCGSKCSGWLHQEIGRVPAKVVRLHVQAASGRSVDIPVKDGWYTVLWPNRDPRQTPNVTVTAYDAQGQVVKPG